MDDIRAAKAGNQLAFRRLVDQHADQVRRTVVSMLGEGPAAEDVAQEVFIRLYGSLKSFEGSAQLSTYLHRIAINLSLDALKKQKRRQRWQLPFGKSAERVANEWADPDVQSERRELQEGIKKALLQLRPEFRAVVTLRLVQGYTVQETAAILNVPSGTVASRLARAQRKLQELLRAEGWG
jgi:RNA polymerase sigma-70 factor (ECF subfamily)